MGNQWVDRKAHSRLTKSGKLAYISPSRFLRIKAKTKLRKPSQCPNCGASIIINTMPNGGLVYFEGGEGLSKVKHSCFTIGYGLSRKRDQDTPDLFKFYKLGYAE